MPKRKPSRSQRRGRPPARPPVAPVRPVAVPRPSEPREPVASPAAAMPAAPAPSMEAASTAVAPAPLLAGERRERSATRFSQRDYGYVRREFRRIVLLASAIIIALIVISFFLP